MLRFILILEKKQILRLIERNFKIRVLIYLIQPLRILILLREKVVAYSIQNPWLICEFIVTIRSYSS